MYRGSHKSEKLCNCQAESETNWNTDQNKAKTASYNEQANSNSIIKEEIPCQKWYPTKIDNNWQQLYDCIPFVKKCNWRYMRYIFLKKDSNETTGE